MYDPNPLRKPLPTSSSLAQKTTIHTAQLSLTKCSVTRQGCMSRPQRLTGIKMRLLWTKKSRDTSRNTRLGPTLVATQATPTQVLGVQALIGATRPMMSLNAILRPYSTSVGWLATRGLEARTRQKGSACPPRRKWRARTLVQNPPIPRQSARPGHRLTAREAVPDAFWRRQLARQPIAPGAVLDAFWRKSAAPQLIDLEAVHAVSWPR